MHDLLHGIYATDHGTETAARGTVENEYLEEYACTTD